MASSNWMWAAAEEIHNRLSELERAAIQDVRGKSGPRNENIHLKWTELAAEIISKHYMKCPSCEGEDGKVQVDETGDDQWYDCEECHGTGENYLPF